MKGPLTGVLPQGGRCPNGILDGGSGRGCRSVSHAHRDRLRREGYHGGVGACEKHVLTQARRGAT